MERSLLRLNKIAVLILIPGLILGVQTTVIGCTKLEDTDTAASAVPREETPAATGYVLYPDDGEVLVPCRPGSTSEGRWIIKADSLTTGSTRLAMGTQLLPGGEQIPVHRHEHQDEILFIHEGHATGIVGDSTMPIEPGTTIYVPRGLWHGVQNSYEQAVEIVWVVAPPGLEGYFRAVGVDPGAECIPLPADEMEEIRRRHGITQRIE